MNKTNKFLQKLAYYPFAKCYSENRDEVEGADPAPFFFGTLDHMAKNAGSNTPDQDLAALRNKITDLVARNAVSMVQQAIDSVIEDGHYQAIKYLFEMIGLYPASADAAVGADTSLASLLLERLELHDSDRFPKPAATALQGDSLE